MEDKDLQELFDVLQPSGAFSSVGELQAYLDGGNDIKEFWPEVETAVTDPQNDYYEMFTDSTQFADYAMGLVKKKDDGQLDSDLVPTSAELSSVPVIGNITSEEEPERTEQQFFKNDWGWFGDTFFGDAIADIGYSLQQGNAVGNSASEALDLLYSGAEVSDEDLEEFIESFNYSQSFLPTDEMQGFQQDAEAYGGGFFGTLYAGLLNPEAGMQMMATSLSQLTNDKALAAGSTIVGGGAVAGSVIPGAGTITGAAATLPYAMGIAGAMTETGMVFQELMMDELKERKLDVSPENLRVILSDPTFLAKARWTSGVKGGVTGVVDAFGGAAVSRLGGTALRGGKGMFRAADDLVEKGVDVIDAIPEVGGLERTARRINAVATTSGGEAAVGGLSEAAGQLAAYGEVSGKEVAEEIIGGTGKGPISLGRAILMGPTYKINGQKVKRQQLVESLHGLSLTEVQNKIANGEIEITRDDNLKNFLTESRGTDEASAAGATDIDETQAFEDYQRASKESEAAAQEYQEFLRDPDSDPTSEEGQALKKKYEESRQKTDDAFSVYQSAQKEGGTPRPDQPKPKTTVREEDDVPDAPEETPEPTELEKKLADAKAKLEEVTNTEAAAADRRQSALEENGIDEEAADLQEKINRLQAKLDKGVTKKGVPFKKKGKENLQKSIDKATEALRELYQQAGLEEDVATILQSSRERAQMQNEVDDLQTQVDAETTAREAQQKQDKRADSFQDLQAKQKSLKQEVAEMKAERDRMAKQGMGDSPQAKDLNKQIAAAEKELSRTNVEVQQARMADRKKKEAAVNDKLKRYGLDKDRTRPAKQIEVTTANFGGTEATFYNGFQMGSLFNRPVIITGFGQAGTAGVKGTLRGFLKLRDNGLVEFVTHDGRKRYQYGNINDGFDIDELAENVFMAMDNDPTPVINETGTVVVNGKTYRLATEKQYLGISRYKNNNIKDMIVIDEDGKEVMLVQNGRLKPSNKPATGFSAEVAAWAEQNSKRQKGQLEDPEIIRAEETPPPVEGEPAAPTDPPQGPPEDGTPDAEPEATPEPDQPKREGQPTTDPRTREQRLREDGVFGTSWMGRNFPAIERIRRRTLSERQFMPKSVQEFRDRRKGRLNLHTKRVERTAKAFDKAWRSASKNMTLEQKEAAMSALDKMLRGEQVEGVTGLGITAELSTLAKQMRTHIDEVSQDLLDSGIVPDKNSIDPETGETFNSRENIENNLGTYVTRSFELYDGKDWSKRVGQETKNEAVQYFKERIADDNATKKAFEAWAERQSETDADILQTEFATKLVNGVLGKESETLGVNTGAQDAANFTPLRQRKDVDPRLRALLGERTDPAANYAITMAKVATMVEKAKALQDVKEMGLKMGWLFDGASDVGVEGFDTPIEIPGMPDEMNPLAGMVTSKEIAAGFMESPTFAQQAQSTALGDAIAQLQSIAKWNKTIGSGITHMRNIVGNLAFVAANGHLDLGAANTSATQVYDVLFDNDNAGYNRLVELGVVGQQSNLQEIKELMGKGTAMDALERRYRGEGSALAKAVAGAQKGKFNPIAMLNKLYQVEDDMFKIYGFEIEKSRYAKAMYGGKFDTLTPEQQAIVEQKAAGIIKNVYPNYSRIGNLIKGISKFPLVGTFLAFQAESYRNAYNIGTLAIQELRDPSTRAIGAKRLAGITSYFGAKAYAQTQMAAATGYGLMGALGMGGKQEDEMEQRKNDYDDLGPFLPPWAQSGYRFGNIEIGTGDFSGHELIITDIDRENGKVKYIDLSSTDAFSAQNQVFQRMLAGFEGRGGSISDNDIVDGFAGGLIELIGPFVEEDMTASLLTQFRNNARDGSGTMIFDPDATEQEKMQQIGSWFWKLMPSLLDQASKLKINNATEGYGETNLEKMQAMMGFREIEVDIAKQFNFGQVSDFKKRFQTANKIKFQGGEAAVEAETAREIKLYKELAGYVQSARNLGADPDELYKNMANRLTSVGITRKLIIDGDETEDSALDLIMMNDLESIENITPNYVADYKVDEEGNYVNP